MLTKQRCRLLAHWVLGMLLTYWSFRGSAYLVAFFWFLHALYDFFHDSIFINTGVFTWYPFLCGGRLCSMCVYAVVCSPLAVCKYPLGEIECILRGCGRWVLGSKKLLFFSPQCAALCFTRHMKRNISYIVLALLVFLWMAAAYRNNGNVIDTFHDRDAELIETIVKVVELYKKEKGDFPPSLEALVPKYLNRVPSDSCGVPLKYAYPGTHDTSSFDLWSEGCPGKHDGVRSWQKA